MTYDERLKQHWSQGTLNDQMRFFSAACSEEGVELSEGLRKHLYDAWIRTIIDAEDRGMRTTLGEFRHTLYQVSEKIDAAARPTTSSVSSCGTFCIPA